MTSTQETAFIKLAHTPVGAVGRITHGAYKGHICIYTQVRAAFAVEVLIRREKGFVPVTNVSRPQEFFPCTTLEPYMFEIDATLYNISELPEPFARPPILHDRAGLRQEGSDGWRCRHPDAGLEVWTRTPTDAPDIPQARPDLRAIAMEMRAHEMEARARGEVDTGPSVRASWYPNPKQYSKAKTQDDTSPGTPSEYITDHRATDFPIAPWGGGSSDGPVKKVCSSCITPSRYLKRCVCCKDIGMHTYYCNKTCQRKHRQTHVREKTEGCSLPDF
jgi:hypothetical protein